MPVGTQGTVKGLTAEQVSLTGAQMILGNTYHLAVRPGADTVANLGGLHRFMQWDGPLLTDSGGFQIFSLTTLASVNEDGVTFRSHVDGRQIRLTPEDAIAIQETLGSDVAMVLDHVVRLPAEPDAVHDAMERTVRWAERCQRAAARSDQAQFAIVQGGLNPELRLQCLARLVALDFPGYAVGGLSVGESPLEMYAILDALCPAMPADRPRYLMGVGTPHDILEAVDRGIDLFDCVLPTRNGRNALAFTDDGPLRIRNQKYARDPRPIDENCSSIASPYSRGYIRHLFLSQEMLGPILLSAHNLAYYQKLVRDARDAISQHRFPQWKAEKLARWQSAGFQPDADRPRDESVS
jgi:queuine tRNA-ribosyltransferase